MSSAITNFEPNGSGKEQAHAKTGLARLREKMVIPALAAFALVIFFARLHTYNEPLERDVTTYGVIAHEMLKGRSLYSDLWDHKPPGVHISYAAAELVAGYGRQSIFVLNIAAALTTLLFCYLAGSAGGSGPLGGLTAAAIWALVSGDLSLEANQPNTEVFLNACLTGALALLIRTKGPTLGVRRVIAVGSLFFLASLYKHVALVPAFALACAHVISTPAGARKQALIDVARIVAIGALGWAAVFGYFAIQGRSEAFIDAAFIYNQYYAGSISQNLGSWLRFPPLPLHAILLGASLGLITVGGLVLGMFQRPRRPWLLLLGALIAVHVAVLLPGQFFAHYYQLWIPPLVIGAGWTVALLRRVLPERIAWTSYAVAAAVVIGFGGFEISNYQVSAEMWSIRKYGRVFAETDRLAATLDKLLKPNESFYEWGSESGLYLLTRKDPPCGIMFSDPLLLGPLKKELLQRLSDDLQRDKPDLIILERQTVARQPSHPFLTWVKQNYRTIFTQQRFCLLARKDSALAAEGMHRLDHGAKGGVL